MAAHVGIGVLILMPNRVRWQWGLRFSMVWGAVVWMFGEAFGGILAPGASVWTGAAGPVLIYVLGASLLLWPDAWKERRAAMPQPTVLSDPVAHVRGRAAAVAAAGDPESRPGREGGARGAAWDPGEAPATPPTAVRHSGEGVSGPSACSCRNSFWRNGR